MALYKTAEFKFSSSDLLAPQKALADDDIAKRFIKLAKKLKRVAPKANDFLYGHAIMMHAAEAALVDQKTGEPVLNKEGKPSSGAFEEFDIGSGKKSVRWVSPDDIKPYKNANGDIFPEDELLKAYKSWVGKPLCKDHKSDSVDGIRGIIIDTFYDPKFKRVHALFALDRKNYGDLARKVETGYANCVSMGTGVGRSICTDCGNIAMTERDYCSCIRARAHYGEINLDLSPIELSLVVNGADPSAKIRQIVAHMNEYATKKQARIEEMQNSACVNPTELQSLADSLNDMQTKITSLMQLEKSAQATEDYNPTVDTGVLVALLNRLEKERDPEIRKLLERRVEAIKGQLAKQEAPAAAPEDDFNPQPARATSGGGSEYTTPEWIGSATEMGINPTNRLASRKRKKKEGGVQGAISNEMSLLRSKVSNMENMLKELKSMYMEENHMNSARLKARAKARRAYWLGGGGVNEPTPGKPKYEKEDSDSIRDKEDKQMVGEPLETGSDGLHPGDLEVKKKWLRAEELEDRRMRRRAYWQGGGGLNEPAPGKEKYPKEDSDSIRDKEDKQMVGDYDMGGTDGMVPGDEPVKKKWLRARLRAKFTKVADDQGQPIKEASRWDVYAGDKLILTATGSEIYGDQLNDNWDYLRTEDYGKNVIRHIREEGFDRTAYLLKGAQDPLAPLDPAAVPADPAAAPAEPAAEAPAAPVAEEGAGGEVEVKQEKDETQQKVEGALNTMEEKIAEIRDLIADMESDELVDIDVNVDEDGKGEGGAAPAAPAPEAGGEAGALEQVLSASRKDVMKIEALMDVAADELAEASETLSSLDKVASKSHKAVLRAVNAALEDSETILAKAEVILEAAKKDKDDEDKDDKKDKKDKKDKDDKKPPFMKKDKDDDDDDKDDKEAKAQKLLDDALRLRAENRAALLSRAYGDEMLMDEELGEMCACGPEGHEMDCMFADDDMMAVDPAAKHELDEIGDAAQKIMEDAGEAERAMSAKDGKDEDKKDKDDKDDKKDDNGDDEDEQDAMFVDESPEMVLAARKAERDGLVAQAGEILGKYELDLGKAENATEPKYFEAHPGGKGTVTDLSHTKTPEAKVETISEIHDVMRDVAESGPRNIREAAAVLQEQIVKGAMTAEDIDRLVAEGKVDSAAASYWKQYFGQAPDSGSFGADMSKEFATKKKEAGNKAFRARLRRAYDIGLEAQEKGLIGGTRGSLDSYVDELMSFDDQAFESTKRVVSSYNASKRTSGSVPRVGTEPASEPMAVTASTETQPSSELDLLSALDWK